MVLRKLKSILRLNWIKIAHSKHGVILSQRKYALDLLQETGLLVYKQVLALLDIDLWDETGPLFEDVSQHRRLLDKLIYLTVTRPDTTYVIRLVSHFIGRLP